MSFGIEEAITTANQLASLQANRNLTDVEISVLKGAWEKLDYDQIAAQNQYATSYISQDAAPKLWKLLSSALGEKVRKSSFREALKRRWEENKSHANSATVNRVPQNRSEAPNRETLPTITDYLEISSDQPLVSPNIYIDRPPVEAMCCEALAQPGALVRVKAPRYMGKTLLANTVLAQFTQANYRTVNLSFGLADRDTHLTNLNKFLRWLCSNISRELEMPSQLNEIWDEEGIGAKVSCTAYFEDYLLTHSNQPLILCLDDVDLLFPYPEVYEDFFGLLRSWHEKARNRPVWQQFRLIIAHSTEVYIRLNINQSPFNVGLSIELPEFSVEQVQDFATQSGLGDDPTQIEHLIAWIGGHPYLLEAAFSYLRTHPELTLDSILTDSATLMEVYKDHLREQWAALQDYPQLLETFTQILQSSQSVQLDPIIAYQLQSMGLIQPAENQIRCQLYQEYFSAYLP
ncbi:MAG: AAA-like domain-containing protein [Cyanobacteria bacterium J06560_6]